MTKRKLNRKESKVVLYEVRRKETFITTAV